MGRHFWYLGRLYRMAAREQRHRHEVFWQRYEDEKRIGHEQLSSTDGAIVARQAGETLGRAQLTTGEVRPFVASAHGRRYSGAQPGGPGSGGGRALQCGIQRLAELAYQRDYDGGMPNLAATTGRIEIATPMGEDGAHDILG